jgi:predicted dehydrogenase
MKIAVLGGGSIGLRHAQNAAAMNCAVTVYDPDSASLARAKALGLEAQPCRSAALAAADAAIVASPSRFHMVDAIDSVEHGCHVLIEKPMATSTSGMDTLLKTSDARGVRVFVAQNLRVHPAVKRAVEFIQQSRLGTLLWSRLIASSYLPSWRPGSDHRANYTSNPRTGGAIFDYVHELDLAWHLLGRYEVQACIARSTGTLGISAEDTADIVVRHDSGLISNIHVDYVSPIPERITSIAGTDGRIDIDIPGRRLRLLDNRGATVAYHGFGGEHADDYRTELVEFFAGINGTRASLLSDGTESNAILKQVLEARSLAKLPADDGRLSSPATEA